MDLLRLLCDPRVCVNLFPLKPCVIHVCVSPENKIGTKILFLDPYVTSLMCVCEHLSHKPLCDPYYVSLKN
jgi:hypothetical protein